MNNAFLTFIWVLVLLCLVFSSSWCNTSSVMMIWSSTPVPTDAIKPAIAARSIFQWIIEATPKIIIISEIVVIKIGIAKNALLYLMYTTNAIPSIANNPAINAPCANCWPNSGETVFEPIVWIFTGSEPVFKTVYTVLDSSFAVSTSAALPVTSTSDTGSPPANSPESCGGWSSICFPSRYITTSWPPFPLASSAKFLAPSVVKVNGTCHSPLSPTTGASTEATSLPVRTVTLSILASKIPGFPISRSTSSGVFPAISTITIWSPLDLTFTSLTP